ncbi:MAG: hypothetical protein LUC97_04130, partial [Clostridiales bacterium]|nr:hypothetical protein [Clostridiales bacterium]
NYMKSERKEGKEEGREEGREEGITETTLSNIKSLIKNLNFSAEKAMQTLGVPLSERDMYLSML